MSPQEPIAVIGTGCRFPGSSSSPSRLWDLLSNPRDVASKVPSDRFSIESFYHPDGLHHGTTDTQESYFLDEDIRSFDAAFFNISAAEAESIDPQQRLLLETIYETLEAGGQTLQDLRGSSAGVFCGVMCSDYDGMMYSDLDALPRYTASGTSRAIISNRVSYFFDWHGPSMTIDTACSSSLVAIHLAAKALRDGDCNVAVAAGTNILLSPAQYISESNLSMLSPNGRGRMWDSEANGYARGEGVASVLLKRLSDAIASGDPIECLIRASDINQDGRSMGITMPSSTAQTQLIQSTYAKAGLDPRKVRDRCQYFEAHGTGTPAGDPMEARAIHDAFFAPGNDSGPGTGRDVLYVGSIKTIIGHTEGTAGLAGLIKGSLAIQHGMIPPNLHFNSLNPKIAPYESNLSVPTKLLPWPKLPPGVPRRVSVNSFGFGGTNAHAILEEYRHDKNGALQANTLRSALPFVFSATSERSLHNVLKRCLHFVETHPTVDLNDLAWSLLRRRTSLSHKVVFYADSSADLAAKIGEKLNSGSESSHLTVISRPAPTHRSILGVFTGQGAQWPRMGIDLVARSSEIRAWITDLQASLDSLPAEYRPAFSLLDELSAAQTSSRIHQAAISQPACTAVQIVLVNILRTLGIHFSTVIGHSSGEIGAAYAAGILSASDAIRIAHLRGHLGYLAGVPGKGGAMLAAGVSYQEADALCTESKYKGRLSVAAVNSPSTVTLSGDQDAVQEVAAHLDSINRFSRLLKVEKAYHSHHMVPCSDPYLRAMRECRIQTSSFMTSRWISSVYKGQVMGASHLKAVEAQYWVDNMQQTVLFHQALEAAARSESVDMIIEVGPHPALKGPAMQTLSHISDANSKIPYVGLLNRGADSIESIATATGALWSNLSMTPSNLEGYAHLFCPEKILAFVKDLPTYPFDHSQSYWGESRASKARARPQFPPNALLGRLMDVAEGEWRWRNFLRREELDWLDDHRVQSQSVFPAFGYVAMVHEAARIVTRGTAISLIEVNDLTIEHAIQISDSPTGTETLFALEDLKDEEGSIHAMFTCYGNLGGTMRRCATGTMRVLRGEPHRTSLPPRPSPVHGLTPVDVDDFYSFETTLGFGYSGVFRGIKSLARKRNTSSAIVAGPPQAETEPRFLLHPAIMDAAGQVFTAAVGSPEDGQVYTLHVPARIRKVTISLLHRDLATDDPLTVEATVTDGEPGINGDIDFFDKDGNGVLQVEGLYSLPLIAPTPQDDRLLFSDVVWGPLHPNAELSYPQSPSGQVTKTWDRFAMARLKASIAELAAADLVGMTGHRAAFLEWAKRTVQLTEASQHPICAGGWFPTDGGNEHILPDNESRNINREIIQSAGESLVSFLRADTGNSNGTEGEGRVSAFQEASAELATGHLHLAQVVNQIVFRFPCMKILEIGGGTTSATEPVFDQIGTSFHSYTYTHTSQDALQLSETRHAGHSDNFICRALDIENDPLHQGFNEHSYDLVIISHSIYNTGSPPNALANIRRLVKPGGYVVLLEVTDINSIYFPLIHGFSDKFWQTEDGDFRLPLLGPAQWDSLLRGVGFSGVDTLGMASGLHSVLVSQAISDAISLLREPLSFMRTASRSESLVIIGGASAQTSSLVAELEQILRPYFTHVTRASSLSTLEVPQSGRVAALTVADLDSECFKDLTPSTLQRLQALLNVANKFLWVTPGPDSRSPYQSMIQGLLRCVALENTEPQYQQLSLDDAQAVDARTLASLFMQLVHADFQNHYTLPNLLWTTEPELWLKDGVLQIPRIRPVNVMNKRYMANRRPIHDRVLHRQRKVKAIHDFNKVELFTDTSVSASPNRPQIEVDYSTPFAIQIHGVGFLHVVIGRTVGTQQRVLALSAENASVVTVPSTWVLPFPIAYGSSANVLAAMSAALVALHILKCATPGTNILLHESNEAVRAALRTGAPQFYVQPFFSTSRGPQSSSPDQIFIHPENPIRRLKQRLPVGLSVIAHLDSGSRHLEELLHIAVPDDVRQLNVTNLYRLRPLVSGGRENGKEVVCTLALAWRLAQGALQSGSVTALPVPIQHLSGTSAQPGDVGVVDWTACDPVTVRERMASSHVSLSPHKSYLLIGMTGDLGRSVCEWMIARGARVVVLASRTPKLEQWWVDDMTRSGARVRALPMDVTDRESVLRAAKTIQEELPPIGGVVNGAMVLNEHFFSELSFDDMQRMLKPKVIGSMLLDELFSQTNLDFFILFGSSVGITGNPGQSAYAAATTFMAGIIHRRKMRGLVGSIINPGGIYNVGFVARLGAGFSTISQDIFGMIPVSEQDLHEVFAEGILAGRVDSGRSPVILAGLGPVDPLLQPRIIWYPDPRLWGFLRFRSTAQASSGQGQTKELASASTMQEAAEIIQTSLVAKVRKTLKLSSDDPLTSESVLMELGVDSLIAVELRSWLIKEIAVDIPILKIFGGLSIGDIVRQATESSSHLTQLRESPQEVAVEEDRDSGNERSLLAPNHASEPTSGPSSDPSSESPSMPEESSSLDGISSDTDYQVDTQPDFKPSQPIKESYKKVESLSFAQSRFWFLIHLVEDQAAFNVTQLFRMKVTPRIEDLRAAIQTVSMRHESLRTCYLAEAGKNHNPCQAILPRPRLQMEEYEVDDEEGVAREYDALRNHVYDLKQGDVARVRLISCRSTYFLILGWHHIAMDGESGNIFLRELGLTYLGEPLPPLPRQYTEYAVSQRKSLDQGEMDDDLTYWKSQFDTFPEPLPLLPVNGMTGPRRALRKYEMEDVMVKVDAPTMNKIRAACKKARASPFHFFLTVLWNLLYHLTCSDDICIGIADANRLDSANQGIVGFLLNLLPIRFRARAAGSAFREVLGSTRDLTYKALAHSRLPFDTLLNKLGVPRSTTHSPLFQVLIDWQPQSGETVKLGDIELSTEKVSPGQTSYDLSLLVASAVDGGAFVNFRLQKAFYGAQAGAQISKGFVNLLQTYADDLDRNVNDTFVHTPSHSPFHPPAMASEIELGRGPSMTAKWPSTLSRKIDQIAAQQPEKVALKEANGGALTYQRLQNFANSIASRILAFNPEAGARVCVFQHPTASLIASMLAVWKLNLVYVPLDLRNPVPRLVSMIKDCQPSILLCTDETFADTEALGLPATHVLNVSGLYSNEQVAAVANKSEPQAPAVILYTSGTTGRPKGIQLNHASFRNQIEGYTTRWGIGAETVLQQAAITFDHSLDQILVGLCNGGRVVIATRSLRGDPVALTRVLVEEGITYTKATPSEYATWLRYGFESCRRASTWRFAFGGGERLSSSLAKSFRELRLSSLRFFNSYGPAEITISSHKMEIDYKGDSVSNAGELVPVGYSMPNYSTYVVDEEMRNVPPGVSGEILIGGEGLCMGYLGQEELNRRCFIDNPFASPDDLRQGRTKLYRTLDRGHLLPDGRLVVEGRLEGDTQVKIRGIRMELEEIEHSLIQTSNGAVIQAIASVREDDGDDHEPFLVAHVVFAAHCNGDVDGHLKHLRENIPLPQYMHPSVIVPLAELPITGHGKVDRRAVASLPLPKASKISHDQQGSLPAAERSMLNFWMKVLPASSANIVDITGSTDFFLAGGSSILLVKLQSVIHETQGIALPLMDLLENSKLGAMAAVVDRSKPASAIDWEAETSLSDLLLDVAPQLPTRRDFTIILTGVTGFLGKHILQKLLLNPTVAHVHAVAVRPRGSSPRCLPSPSSKLTLHNGDFASPNLGLDDSTFAFLSQAADVVIHCGAGRSFWDPYHVLRDSVSSTKSLIKMANRRRIPIHFISSESVGSIAEGMTPPTDGQGGYVASKWASDRLLSNAASQFGIPVFSHRPAAGMPALGSADSLIHELRELVTTMRCLPTAGGWNGSCDLLPVTDLAGDIAARALASVTTAETAPHVLQIQEHPATVRLGMAEFLRVLEDPDGLCEGFEHLPFIKWIGLAKREYGFRWLVTSQDATVQEGALSLIPQF